MFEDAFGPISHTGVKDIKTEAYPNEIFHASYYRKGYFLNDAV